ncbi:MAG: hypothetical protein AAFQ21_14880 [Pseudomonadota bacterium]
MFRSAALFSVLALAACGNNEAPAPAQDTAAADVVAGSCADIIQRGAFDRHMVLDVDQVEATDEALDAIVRTERMSAGDVLAVNRNRVAKCDMHQAHAKGLPVTEETPERERIRLVMVNVASEDSPATIEAAAERFLCDTDTGSTWSDAPCTAN